MIFFSYQFVAFTALFFVAYYALVWPTARRGLILVACLAFQYHFAGPAGVYPILVLLIGTFLVGYSRKRALCTLWIAICVASLVFYKYVHFAFQNVLGLAFPDWAATADARVKDLLPLLPPLGISFFVFEFVHYLMEVRHGKRPIVSPVTFALFGAFWPTLVAGPIKRYRQFTVSQALGVRTVAFDDVAAGLARVMTGATKKFAGDVLTGWIEFRGADFERIGLGMRWAVFFAIGARILLDFSGYSDMAIGFARMMGIRVPENFNWPYLAHNIIEFWRRWHISLSTWIRDYVYIPLGGNRQGPARKAINALIAMALCGLWHGASWNFALWGVYHGLGLVIANSLPLPRLLASRQSGLGYLTLEGGAVILWRAASWAITLLFVHVGWLLFFYPIGTALHMAGLLVGIRAP